MYIRVFKEKLRINRMSLSLVRTTTKLDVKCIDLQRLRLQSHDPIKSREG